tara:strand:+ start:21704 stop:21904 length:201 start_codon:yes stop_codon:yes gene_type:complete
MDWLINDLNLIIDIVVSIIVTAVIVGWTFIWLIASAHETQQRKVKQWWLLVLPWMVFVIFMFKFWS